MIPILKDVDAVLAGSEPYTLKVLESAPDLKIIARVGVGYDKVDVKSAIKKSVVITWTPIPELSISVAEETLYRARVSLDEHQRRLLIGARGQARVHVAPRSLGGRLYRYLSRTFSFSL